MKFLKNKFKHIIMLSLCTMMSLSYATWAGEKTSVQLAHTEFMINGTMTDTNDGESNTLMLMIDQGRSILLLAASFPPTGEFISNTCATNNPVHMAALRNTDFESHIIAFIKDGVCLNIITAKSSIYAPEAK